MDPNLVTKDDFKTHFFRDFKYGNVNDACNAITDEDLDKAFVEAKMNFNRSLWSNQDQLKIALLYLVAHYLVSDIQMAKGNVNSASNFPVNSRSIGSISESYQIPDWVTKSPYLATFASTQYGVKYCSLVRPRLVGNVQVYRGATTF